MLFSGERYLETMIWVLSMLIATECHHFLAFLVERSQKYMYIYTCTNIYLNI